MKRNLLIVDDDFVIRRLLELHYQTLGYICTVAVDGAEALAILARGQIHVMITDLEMPGVDGIALLRSVRKQGLVTRCVVITGHASIGNLTACLREGATALVPKPLNDLTRLNQAVEQAFEQMLRWAEQMKVIVGLVPKSAPVTARHTVTPRDDLTSTNVPSLSFDTLDPRDDHAR